MSKKTNTTNALVPIVRNFEPMAARYDALLCDIWGVLHNGETAYDGVVEALRNYRAGGGKIMLLSNASRPSDFIPGHLAELGIPRDTYDDVVTSGDATRASINDGQFGKRFWHLGPDRNHPTYDGLDLELVSLDDADFVLCTSLVDDDVETPDDYAGLLGQFKARDLDFVCANPDLVVDRGERQVYCGGALADAYTKLGGRSHYFGKPHAPIYQLARQKLEVLCGKSVANDRILAVGDGMLTDIRGAEAQGVDALFITGGIAVERCGSDAENPQSDLVSALSREIGVWPTAAMPRMRW